MKRIGMGIVGTGFIGPHHIDAVRRLGYVDIVAIAGTSDEKAAAQAAALYVPKGYGRYEDLLNDPRVDVVHNATPNNLHFPVNLAAIEKGKHVVSDKPLAMTAAEAKTLVEAATKAGVVHAVTFSYRGNPLVQQARHQIARGDIGTPHFLYGHYLQDWLLKDTDYSWRLEADKGGASSALGDIGSHWCDTAQHLTGLRITHVLGEITTVIPKRKKPRGARVAFQTGGGDDAFDLVDIKVEDLASVLVRFDNGAKGAFTVAQVCGGHKNDFIVEVCGSKGSVRWDQEKQNDLWFGHRDRANEVLQKDPSLIDAEVRGYAHMPGGHQEGWPDAFYNLMRDIYGHIAAGKKMSDPRPPSFASFEDGYRANRIIETILDSAKHGGVWKNVEYLRLMTTQAFDPKFMKVGVLTAALQELTPREVRDPDPDRAIEEWVDFGGDLGASYIQLSAALHPTESDVPAEAMLDPVANRLDLRQPFDKKRARRVMNALSRTGIGISDVAYFDNMLHDDPVVRKKKHDFMLRVFDAAALLEVDAVCGFVGRNQMRTMDENLVDFEEHFIPLLKAAKERGLTFRVEQCPMPGWTTSDNWHNNIAYAPGPWIVLHRICEKHGVGDQFRIHYDPSHAILMGQDTRSIFQYLKDQGYNFLIGGFHVKGQVVDAKGVSAWGYGGQTMERGDWSHGKPSPNPADQVNAWKKQVILAEHELPGTARHDPLAYLQNRSVDWLDHQLAARELLQLDVANTHLVVEHEYPKARIQDRERLKPILQGSIGFIRRIDQAAACMYALQHEVLPAQGIPAQGVGREAYRS